MTCRDCPFWQGTKYSEWGDCYRVIATLQPQLLECYKTDEWGLITKFFNVPFDPHDVKYWLHDPVWFKLYKEIEINRVGVRCITEKRDDVLYDQKNGERVGKLKLKYYQTHKDFTCEEDDE